MSDANITVLGEKPASRTPTLSELFLPHSGKALAGIAWLIVTNGLLLAIPRLVNEGIAVVEGTTPKGPSVLAPFLKLFAAVADRPTLTMVVASIAASAAVGGVAR